MCGWPNSFEFLALKFNSRYSKEEPFSVINVDIRNHSTLLDSLEQYVKGELLEGADAYHCDKCNKKVFFRGIEINFMKRFTYKVFAF